MWRTGVFAKVSTSDRQGVCRHCERDQNIPSWLNFWLRQTHARRCRWGHDVLWFDWVQFYIRGPMYPLWVTARHHKTAGVKIKQCVKQQLQRFLVRCSLCCVVFCEGDCLPPLQGCGQALKQKHCFSSILGNNSGASANLLD